LDFMVRLAALAPKPRVNLTRYHGVLAPNHRWRGEVTPAKRGKGVKRIANTEVRSPAERHVAMSWAQRLKRVSMGRPSASILQFVVAAVGPLKSSSERRTVALRIRTSSTGSWHIFERRNRKPLPGPSWYRQPGRHNIPVAEIGSVADPDNVRTYLRPQSVRFVDVHARRLSISTLTCRYS
jgi:hypothetical protein